MTIVPVASWVRVWSTDRPISAPGPHLAGDQVRLDELLRHVPCHGQAATPGLAW